MSEPTQTAPWTVRTLLVWARNWLAKKGIESPRLDAELLLARALRCDRLRLYVDHDKPLQPEELAAFKQLLLRRGEREPVAYILGEKEFYGRPFAVDRRAFIPRPETELLVQAALTALPEGEELRALDLCAGSGIVGTSIAAERPCVQVDLVELSPDAAQVAQANAERHGGGRARVWVGDLFAPLPPDAKGSYAVIAANPPYIPLPHRVQLAPEIDAHEPHLALFGGDDGLTVIRRLVVEASAWLSPGGLLVFELDPVESEQAAQLCRQAGLTAVEILRDLAGLDRLVRARRAS